MIEQVGNALRYTALFLAANEGAPGLTVVVDVWRNGARIVSNAPALEVGSGLYSYTLAAVNVNAEGEYIGVFKVTVGTAQPKNIAVTWYVGPAGVENLNASIASRATPAAVWQEPTAARLDVPVSSRATPADVTNATARLDVPVSTRATPGDLANLDAPVSSRAKPSDLANLDAPVSSRATPGDLPGEAPTVGEIWAAPSAGLTAAGSIGKQVATTLDAPVSSVGGGSGTVLHVGPVAGDGAVTIVRGDDYLEAEGRALEFGSEGDAWPDLEGAAVELTVTGRGVSVVPAVFLGPIAGKVEGTRVLFDLTADQTGSIRPNVYAFVIQATLASGSVATLWRGPFTVLADPPVPADVMRRAKERANARKA